MSPTLQRILAEFDQGTVSRWPNAMAVLAEAVIHEVSHGSRETLFDLAQPLERVFNNLRVKHSAALEVLRTSDDADLGDVIMATYLLGQLSMAQQITNTLGARTISMPDFDYLQSPEVVEVLRAIDKLHNGTDQQVAESLGKTVDEIMPILERTYEIGASMTVVLGLHRTNRLGPLGKQIIEMQQ